MVRMGSLFAGIGGFELGAEMAFDEAGIPHQTLWQVEQNKYCQKVLARHWPSAKIYDDVRNITKDNIAPVDVIMAGFPCQDISSAGLQRGIYEGEKSSLWWEVWRIARDLRPRVLVLENVANILRLGGSDVVGSLASIGYSCEWSIISAKQFGAPHLRKRWFCVAYTSCVDGSGRSIPPCNVEEVQKRNKRTRASNSKVYRQEEERYWQRNLHPSAFCRVDDGIPDRSHRLKALGNAIVPQCSQYVFECIIKSGLLS